MSMHGWKWKNGLPLALTYVAVLALDRLTKRWAASPALYTPVEAIPGILGWRFALNKGAAFSAFAGAGPLLCALTALIIAAALGWLLRHPACEGWLKTGLTLLVAGGLGNLYDRVFYGSVIDFIELLFVRFAIFNVADIAVVCGAACMLIGVLRTEERKRDSVSRRR